jgi:predicted nuclease with TOPRIM domain
MIRKKDDLERQLDYNQKIMDSLAAELVREKNDKLKLQDDLKPIKNENEVLMRQIKMLNDRKIILEKDMVKVQDEKITLGRRVNELEALLKDQILKMDDLKKEVSGISATDTAQPSATPPRQSSVELPAIVVRPQSESVGLDMAGRILAVNKENGFVVIDLGEDRGIKLGQSFQVYRDNQVIGNIEVIQTRPNISACDIKRESTPIKVGDGIK